MPKNIRAGDVIAFDRRNRPITVPPGNWNVRFGWKAIELKYRGTRLVYKLDQDPICFSIVNDRESLALVQTAGRLALTGAAGGLLRKGSFLGAALADLSIRGAAKRHIYTAWLLFSDHTSIAFECTTAELQRLLTIVPQAAASEMGQRRAAEILDLKRRMVADGDRVLSEIDEEIGQLEVKLKSAMHNAQFGAHFAERDAARKDEVQVEADLADKRILRRSVSFSLAAKTDIGAGRQLESRTRHSSMIVWGGGGLIALFFLSAIILPPAANDPVPGDEAAVPPPAVQPHVGSSFMKSAGRGSSNTISEVQSETRTRGPSFSCEGTLSRIEKIICSSPRVSATDVEMAELYQAVKKRSRTPQAIVASQVNWLKAVRNACDNEACLLTVYRRRIDELNSIGARSLHIRG